MANIFDRLAEGPDAMQESDYSDWSEMIGSAPPDRFHRAAHQAIRQVPADEYRRHVTPGIDGTDPLGRLQPQQRSGIIQSLLGALFGNGVDQRQLEQNARLQSLNPNDMSNEDLANLLEYTQRTHPEILSDVSTQYRNQPNLLHSILGNRTLMSLALGLGAQILMNQMGQRGTPTGLGPRPTI